MLLELKKKLINMELCFKKYFLENFLPFQKKCNIHFSGKFSAKEAVIKAIGHYDPSYKIF